MKRYHFPLETVLRVRRIQQDAARAELTAANLALTAADRAVADRFDRYAAQQAAGGAAPAEAWLAQRACQELAAASVVSAGKARELAETETAERRQALQAVTRRVAALARLDERRRADHAVAVRRDEDLIVDELVTARHGRAR